MQTTVITQKDRTRAARTLHCVGRGIHPDEALVVLAEMLDITYEPRVFGRRMRVRVDAIDARVNEIMTNLNVMEVA
jgi:hypothetical protein